MVCQLIGWLFLMSALDDLKKIVEDHLKRELDIFEKTFGLNEDDANTLNNTYNILGTLKSMKETIDNGYLLRFEDIIFAETFSNLIDQSEYLFKQGYILAAGVLGRAVLEEKLRNLCKSHNVFLTKKQTTISGYNMELYKSKIYDKIEFKNIDLLASIGNNAAHNKPITKEEVKKLLTGVLLLLNKYK